MIQGTKDIVTGSYKSEKLRFQDLHVWVGEKEAALLVHDPKTNQFVRFMAAPLKEAEAFESWIKDSFSTPFRETRVIVTQPRHVMFPKSLFDRQKAIQAFQFHHDFSSNDEVLMQDALKNPEAYLLYNIPKSLDKTLQQTFGRFGYKHSISAFLTGLQGLSEEPTRLSLNIYQSEIQLVLHIKDQLVFENAFHFEAQEDILYYTLAVIEQYGLSPKEMHVEIAGNTSNFDQLLELLRTYIFQVQPIKRPKQFEYDEVFEDIPSHWYFSLFSSPLCEF